MRRSINLCVVAVMGMWCVTGTADAASRYTFTEVAYPGAAGGTGANGINDAGQIVGTYALTAGGVRHGFLLSQGVFSAIDYPGALETIALGISRNGDIVGVAQSCLGNGYGCAHSFILSGGVFTILPDAPGSLAGSTFAWAINSSGAIAGWYVEACFCRAHSFVFSGGAYTTVNRPGYSNTTSRGLNDLGQLPGASFQCWGCGPSDGFVLTNGVFTAFNPPVAGSSAEVTGLNNGGDFVGNYSSGSQSHAFAVNGGTLVLVEHPAAPLQTAIWGQAINATRQVVGSYFPADGLGHAFRATPTVPKSQLDCKDGGWQNLARSDGSFFKNQGACVSFVNTGK